MFSNVSSASTVQYSLSDHLSDRWPLPEEKEAGTLSIAYGESSIGDRRIIKLCEKLDSAVNLSASETVHVLDLLASVMAVEDGSLLAAETRGIVPLFCVYAGQAENPAIRAAALRLVVLSLRHEQARRQLNKETLLHFAALASADPSAPVREGIADVFRALVSADDGRRLLLEATAPSAAEGVTGKSAGESSVVQLLVSALPVTPSCTRALAIAMTGDCASFGPLLLSAGALPPLLDIVRAVLPSPSDSSYSGSVGGGAGGGVRLLLSQRYNLCPVTPPFHASVVAPAVTPAAAAAYALEALKTLQSLLSLEDAKIAAVAVGAEAILAHALTAPVPGHVSSAITSASSSSSSSGSLTKANMAPLALASYQARLAAAGCLSFMSIPTAGRLMMLEHCSPPASATLDIEVAPLGTVLNRLIVAAVEEVKDSVKYTVHETLRTIAAFPRGRASVCASLLASGGAELCCLVVGATAILDLFIRLRAALLKLKAGTASYPEFLHMLHQPMLAISSLIFSTDAQVSAASRRNAEDSINAVEALDDVIAATSPVTQEAELSAAIHAIAKEVTHAVWPSTGKAPTESSGAP